MAPEERQKLFENLARLKLKAGETLKTSYFKPGGLEPLFVATDKIDGTFTLYSVNGQTLKKIQSAASIKALEELVLPHIK